MSEQSSLSGELAQLRKIPIRRNRKPLYLLVKRPIDLVLTLGLAPIWLPVIFLLALLASLDGHNPFFTQRRIGRHGKEFLLFKIWTMRPDAESALEAHLRDNPSARLEWDRDQKLRSDPRITRLGTLLRKYSLDELPQFFNVLLGHMSVVGPRPMFPDQRVSYPGSAYFALRPGLTGLWQIGKRNGCSFIERAAHDTRYFNIYSFKTDVHILLLTILVVLRGTGV